MDISEGLVLIAAVGGISALFVYLGRSRERILHYHGIPTPWINEMTHGGGGA